MSNGSTDATRAASDERGLPRQVDRQLSPPLRNQPRGLVMYCPV
jgi:hypothetical protein